MRSIVIQFHAEESEIAQFVDIAIERIGASLVALTFNPFSIQNVRDTDLIDLLNQGCWRFVLTIQPPASSVSSPKEFGERNGEALLLDVGRLNDGVLAESCFAYRGPEGPAYDKWMAFLRKIKKGMIKGVRAVNPSTGASSVVGGHYYTLGAMRMFEAGVKWKTLGRNVLEPLPT